MENITHPKSGLENYLTRSQLSLLIISFIQFCSLPKWNNGSILRGRLEVVRFGAKLSEDQLKSLFL